MNRASIEKIYAFIIIINISIVIIIVVSINTNHNYQLSSSSSSSQSLSISTAIIIIINHHLYHHHHHHPLHHHLSLAPSWCSRSPWSSSAIDQTAWHSDYWSVEMHCKVVDMCDVSSIHLFIHPTLLMHRYIHPSMHATNYSSISLIIHGWIDGSSHHHYHHHHHHRLPLPLSRSPCSSAVTARE